MKLYSYWRSSASWRVRIALAWKEIPYDYVTVDLTRDGGDQYREYRSLNPMSQVPLLEVDGGPGAAPQRIAQSMAILEYLEERWPEPPLLPRDPWRRARARQLAEIVNSGMQPFQNSPGVLGYVKDVLHGDERAWVQHHHARGLVALETTAAETAGKFLVGDEVTFADVFLVPQLYGCRRFGVDLAPYPTLLRVEAACVALPAFAAAQPDRQPDVRPAG